MPTIIRGGATECGWSIDLAGASDGETERLRDASQARCIAYHVRTGTNLGDNLNRKRLDEPWDSSPWDSAKLVGR